ncbi:MAG TPA: tetratricopeptide repeat protein, partial [Candidatus Obscuribacterales bacterium]|nr:tetratricopeptide repeat protein [Candidatus Obscuribacterales bacterium]
DFMIAQNCVGVADIEMRMGKYKDAVKTLDEGVEWQLAHGKELSAFTAGMLNLKAAALHALGKYDEEEKCRLRSLDICRRFSPPQPDPLASTLFQTAARLQQREKFEQAEKLYKEAIAIGAKENDIAYKQVQLQCLAALGEIAIVYRKDTKLAENYRAQLVPTYKKYLRNVTHADISLCLTIGDLCFMLKDKKNLQTLLDTAQSAYDKDPQKRPEQLEKLQRHRKTYNTLLK